MFDGNFMCNLLTRHLSEGEEEKKEELCKNSIRKEIKKLAPEKNRG